MAKRTTEMQIVPIEQFGKDHWSLLVYIETCCVDGVEVVHDRMRTNPNRNLDLGGFRRSMPDSGWKDECSTRLRSFPWKSDSETERAKHRISGHDDWDCLEDLEQAGLVLLISLVNGFVQITKEGLAMVTEIRAHKAAGGQFANLPPMSAMDSDVCCVCGPSQGLTRHHVVPWCFRRPLHHDRVYHDLHDILLVCRQCHFSYERKHATRKRHVLCTQYGVPIEGTGIVWPDGSEAIRSAGVLVRHGDQIPPRRTAELMSTIVSYLEREPTGSDMSELAAMDWRPKPGSDYVSYGELVVGHVEDMQAFWCMWRTHFVSKMKPRFLPQGWDPDREVRWSPERCRRRRSKNCPCAR